MIKPILIVCGEPNSIFSEILIKAFRKYKNKNPIILIGSIELLKKQLQKLNFRNNLNQINFYNKFLNIKKNRINIIDIKYNFKKPFEMISSKSNNYIKRCFDKAFQIVKKNPIKRLINGPISKKHFLGKKYYGITEYVFEKFKFKKDYSMLIYNKSLSVSPITTHISKSKIKKKLRKKDIISKALLIDQFYKKNFFKKPKLGITGLNPHCENFLRLVRRKE